MAEVSAEVRKQFHNFGKAFLQNAHVLDASDSSHSSTLVKGLYGCYKEQKYCDVILKISEERKIRAHRVVLASLSHYFDSLFGNQFAEARKDEVELPGFGGSAVTDLIEFAYSGNIRIHADNVLALLQAANYLGVEFVQETCADFLNSCIDSRSCLKIFEIADVFALENLRKAAKRHVLRHFTNTSKCDGFSNLPLHLLKELVGSEELCVVVEDLIPCEVEQEKIVLQAVLKYVEYDPTARVEYLQELLSLVRLPAKTIILYIQEMENQKLLGNVCKSAVGIMKCKDKSSDAEIGVSARKFAKSVLICGRPLGYGGHVEFMPCREIADDGSDYVTGMKLWIQHLGYLGNRTTLRGIQFFYSDSKEVFVGRKIGETCKFHLQENEKIVKTDVWMRWEEIDQMVFYTNKQDAKGNAIVYGPYGESTIGLYSESPAGSYGYLAGVSASNDSVTESLSLQFTWRTFVFPCELELPCASYKVNDRVLARCHDNFYYIGTITAMGDGQVQIQFDDDSAITHRTSDISAVIPDKVPDPTTLQKNSHVIVSCQSNEYHIGHVNTITDNGNAEVRCDVCTIKDDCFPVDKLRLFPEHTIPHAVGARVFAWRSNDLYYHGFVATASDENVSINFDDGDTITLDKQDRTAVVLDVLPQATEIQMNDRVIGFRLGRNQFYPGKVINIDAVNQKFDVQFDDGDRCVESLHEIRLIPREC